MYNYMYANENSERYECGCKDGGDGDHESVWEVGECYDVKRVHYVMRKECGRVGERLQAH